MSTVGCKCPNCNGTLRFDPSSGQTVCTSCNTIVTSSSGNTTNTINSNDPFDAFNNFAQNFNQGFNQGFNQNASQSAAPKNKRTALHTMRNTHATYDEVSLYTCPNCGAELITAQSTTATSCCYCHSPLKFSKHIYEEFMPNKIIPFTLTREDAQKQFISWRRKQKCLPFKFNASTQLQNLYGLYVPYWLVDCSMNGILNANATKDSTEKLDSYVIYREANMNFYQIPHDASSRANDEIMDHILPYDFSELKDYSSQYLGEFLAENYDLNERETLSVILDLTSPAILHVLENSIGDYTELNLDDCTSRISEITYRYVLMPIWFLAYPYKGQIYNVVINGQTGKTYGNVPTSSFKLRVFLRAFLVFLFALILLNWGRALICLRFRI